jgi:transforming growth factor-beta-induced protein
MKTIKNSSLSIFALILFASLAITNTVKAKDVNKGTSEMNVVEIAIADQRFSILVEAVSKAGLVDALSAEGPYTIFAPTNDAFEKLFKDLGVTGIQDLTAEQLTPILLYHVVKGKVMSADVESGMVNTLNENARMNIEVNSKGVTIDNTSRVIITDVEGTNGVIHAIDKVLMPESKATSSKSGCN